MKSSKPGCGFSKMKGLKALVLKMVAGLDLKGFEKMKAEEPKDIFLLLDESYPDDTLNDGNLVRKEDCEVVEKIGDDIDNVQLSEIKEDVTNRKKLGVCLIEQAGLR